MQAKVIPTETTGRWALVSAVLWVLSYFFARVALKVADPGSAAAVLVVLVPIPAFAAMLWFLIKGIAGADELERRIHLEALAVAFPLSMLLLMTLGLLDLAIDLNPADWSYRHVWPMLALFWFVGLVVARWRYN